MSSRDKSGARPAGASGQAKRRLSLGSACKDVSYTHCLPSQLLTFVVQAEGVLFLPFEQRMTRDVQQRRERRAMRRAKGMGTSSLGSAPSQGSLGSDISKAGLLQGMVSGPSNALVRFCPSLRVSVSSR